MNSKLKNQSNKSFRLFGKAFTPYQSILVVGTSVIVLLAILFVLLRLAVSADHRKAVELYNQNNFINITDIPSGGKQIDGSSDGVAFSYVEDNTFCNGVTVNGVAVGGLSFDEAAELVGAEVDKQLGQIGICLTLDSKCVVLTAVDFGITTDMNEQLLNAFKVGRESDSDFHENYLARQRAEKDGIDFPVSVTYDDQILSQSVENAATLLDSPATEPYITLKSLVGGCKSGVGTGGSTLDVFDSETITVNGTPVAEIIYHYGRNGYNVDHEELLESVKSAYDAGETNITIFPAVSEVEPKTEVSKLKQEFTVLGTCSTAFTTSSVNRARNVQKAAGLLHCVEILPGEEQTYNGILGPRYESDGWLPAAGIAGGKEYADTPGGGICQVSTTLYNALLLVGPQLEITQRYHHSIPGSYIELGLDATVSTNGPDLGWINNSDESMFIVSYADMNKKVVYSFIYGTLDREGLTYKLRSETVSVTPPESPLMIAEPLWPKGYSRVTIKARSRYEVNVYRQCYDKDGQLIEEEFLYTDIYKSVRGEIHYGTGPRDLPEPD